MEETKEEDEPPVNGDQIHLDGIVVDVQPYAKKGYSSNQSDLDVYESNRKTSKPPMMNNLSQMMSFQKENNGREANGALPQ